MILTINVPDEVAAQVSALPAIERRYLDHVAAVAVADALAGPLAGPLALDEAAILAAIKEGTADLEAGRYVSLEDYRARIDAEDAAAAKIGA